MKKNKTIISIAEPDQSKENNTLSMHNDGMQHPGLWMEFEDSFIQILSGIEPARTWYRDIEPLQQQIAC